MSISGTFHCRCIGLRTGRIDLQFPYFFFAFAIALDLVASFGNSHGSLCFDSVLWWLSSHCIEMRVLKSHILRLLHFRRGRATGGTVLAPCWCGLHPGRWICCPARVPGGIRPPPLPPRGWGAPESGRPGAGGRRQRGVGKEVPGEVRGRRHRPPLHLVPQAGQLRTSSGLEQSPGHAVQQRRIACGGGGAATRGSGVQWQCTALCCFCMGVGGTGC